MVEMLWNLTTSNLTINTATCQNWFNPKWLDFIKKIILLWKDWGQDFIIDYFLIASFQFFHCKFIISLAYSHICVKNTTKWFIPGLPDIEPKVIFILKWFYILHPATNVFPLCFFLLFFLHGRHSFPALSIASRISKEYSSKWNKWSWLLQWESLQKYVKAI